MSESVDILIQAEDMATPVIDNAAKSVDGLNANIKKIKESGQQAKKSTDFFKVIANSLGGTEIGSYVGQIGEAAEKTSQFAEVQKLGGAGAFAFKAGLVGLVGTIAFGIGNAIGNVIFQTEKWKEKLANATEETKKLNAALMQMQSTMSSENREDIELIRDPEQKRAAYVALLRSTSKEIEGVEQQIREGRKKTEEFNWLLSDANGVALNEADKAKVLADKERLAAMNQQRLELEKILGPRAAENAAIKEKNALLDKSDSYLASLRDEVELLRATKEEQAGILALRNAIGDEAQEEAKRLLLEKDAIAAREQAAKEKESADAKAKSDQEAITQGSANYVKSLREQLDVMRATADEKADVMASQKAVGGDVDKAAALIREMDWLKMYDDTLKDIEADQKKADQDKANEAKKLRDFKQSELDKLEQERILLTQGAEAAKAFALEKQGLSKADAADLAKKDADLEKLKQRQELAKSGKDIKPEFDEIKGAGPVVASESRLLKRGSTEDPTIMVAKNTTKMIEQNEQLREEIRLMTVEITQLKEDAKVEVEVLAG